MLLSTLIHIFAIIIHCTEGSYGQGNPSSCPVNCDVLGEIDSLRQLINQEGLFRMNLDRQLNDLKDITKSISEERGLLEEKVLRLENETLASSSGEKLKYFLWLNIYSTRIFCKKRHEHFSDIHSLMNRSRDV